jgi:uncharacterized protein YkwD
MVRRPGPIGLFAIAAWALLGPVGNAPAEEARASPPRPSWSALERGILKEINFARTEPKTYASLLEARRRYYHGGLLRRPGQVPLRVQEGVAALEEAIRFLRRQRAAPRLALSEGLTRAGADHVRDTGPRGILGHTGSDGSSVAERASRHGIWHGAVGENIAYGLSEAREVVVALIVDDGVSGRGHRRNLFDPRYGAAGVACGPHRDYRAVCIVTFAASFSERGQRGERESRRGDGSGLHGRGPGRGQDPSLAVM